MTRLLVCCLLVVGAADYATAEPEARSAVTDAITRSIETCDGGDDERIRMEPSTSLSTLELNVDEIVASIEVGANPCRSGRHEAVVRLASERGVRVVRTGYRVVREVRLPVLTQNRPRGYRIRESDVSWTWMDAGRYGVSSPALDGSLTLRRRAIEGEPVTPRLLQAPTLVSRGDVVVVIVRRPGLVVRAEAIAERDGRLGDRIRVRNRASGERFDATVTAENEVTL